MVRADWLRTSFSLAMTAFSFQNGGKIVDVLESQIVQVCYFSFVFSNNHQCNFTKTISHLRLCEYRDSHVAFGD